MDPVTNVELGALYLAHYRDGGGRSTVTVRVRQRDGSVETTVRNVPCPHRDHAWWAHYNHGTRFISHGQARLYPHHVAVLQDALADSLGLAREASTAHYTLKALERADRPTARRYVQLCSLIRATPAPLSALATASQRLCPKRPFATARPNACTTVASQGLTSGARL
jgi:hypothetical protein